MRLRTRRPLAQTRRQLALAALTLLLFSGAAAAAAPDARNVLRFHQWTIVFARGGFRAAFSGNPVLSVGTWPPLKILQSEELPDGIRFTADQRGTTVRIEYRRRHERIVCRWHAERKGRPARFTAMFTFPGGELADETVLLDGSPLRIPAKFEKHEFRHARSYVFSPDRPERRFSIDFRTCRFTNLRDFRRNGRDDLQIFATASESGDLEAVLDFTADAGKKRSERYDDERFVWLDDLHLPDLRLCRNRVRNPDFEAGLAFWGWGVTNVRTPQTPGYGWRIVEEGARLGTRCARYTVARGYNPPMLCTYPVAVKTGETYTASFYARTDAPGAGLSLFIHTAKWGEFPAGAGKRFRLQREWKRYEVTFRAPNPFLRLCFGDRWWDHKAEDQVQDAHIWLDSVQLEPGDRPTRFTQPPVICSSDTGTEDQCVEAGQPAAVVVRVVNACAETRCVRVETVIADLDRRVLLRRAWEESLPPWKRSERRIDLGGIRETGLLRVVMNARSGEYRETFYGRVCRFRPITSPPLLRYGWHMTPRPERARRLEQYGVWGSLSFQPPENPTLCRTLRNLQWVHVFTPAADRNCPIKVMQQKMAEQDWNVWEQWLDGRVRPYRDQVFWKTLNEPDAGDKSWTPADCVRAVEILRRVIRSAAPEARILTPDPCNGSVRGQTWLKRFFEAGGARLVDVVAIHTYRARPESPDLDRDLADLIRLKAAAELRDAPIMLTEGEGTAIYNIPEISMSPFSGFFEWRLGLLGLDVGRAEIAAAALKTRTLLAALKYAPTVTYYLSWRDDVQQGRPLVSLAAVNHLFSRLGRARFRRSWDGPGSVRCYLFETSDQRPVAVMWCHDLKVDRGERPPRQVRIDLPETFRVRVFDLMGNLMPVVSGEPITVCGRPCYICGPSGGLPALEAALGAALAQR